MSTSAEILAKVALFVAAADKAEAIANGPATGEGSTVDGIPTLAKKIADLAGSSIGGLGTISSTTYTFTEADNGKSLNITAGALDVTLPAAPTKSYRFYLIGNGFTVQFQCASAWTFNQGGGIEDVPAAAEPYGAFSDARFMFDVHYVGNRWVVTKVF